MTQTRFKKVPFDIELAKRIAKGEMKGRITTLDGREARIVCWDKKPIDKNSPSYPIVALVKNDCGGEMLNTYTEEGLATYPNYKNRYNLQIEVPTIYKDYSNFVPQKFQPCLVRNGKCDDWWVRVCAGKNENNDIMFFYERGYGKEQWNEILPLNKITARLLTTTKSYEELLQELDAESTAIIPDAEFEEDDKQFDFHEIKTFAEACEKLGMKEHLLTGSWCGDVEAQGQAQALYKLLIIQKAINGIWRDEGGWSYYPYWKLYSKDEMESMSERGKQERGIRQLLSCADAVNTKSSGVRSALVSGRCADAHTDFGFPLCFNSKEAALYAANQFEDLFFQYYGIKVKE